MNDQIKRPLDSSVKLTALFAGLIGTSIVIFDNKKLRIESISSTSPRTIHIDKWIDNAAFIRYILIWRWLILIDFNPSVMQTLKNLGYSDLVHFGNRKESRGYLSNQFLST